MVWFKTGMICIRCGIMDSLINYRWLRKTVLYSWPNHQEILRKIRKYWLKWCLRNFRSRAFTSPCSRSLLSMPLEKLPVLSSTQATPWLQPYPFMKGLPFPMPSKKWILQADTWLSIWLVWWNRMESYSRTSNKLQIKTQEKQNRKYVSWRQISKVLSKSSLRTPTNTSATSFPMATRSLWVIHMLFSESQAFKCP